MKRRWLSAGGPWLLALVLLAFEHRELFSGLVECGRDLFGQHFSDTWFLTERLARFELPLWLPYQRLGQPFLALWYPQVLYPPRWVTGLLFGPYFGPSAMHVFHSYFGFAGGWLAARRLGLSRWAAFVAAGPFFLGSSYVSFAENLEFASSAAWAGWNVWAALGVRTSPRSWSVLGPKVALLALSLSAMLLAGGPEMALWQLALVALIAGRRALVAVPWAGVASAAVLLPTAELAIEWATPGQPPPGQLEWSMSFRQLFSFALPGADRPWGDQVWADDQWFLASLFIGTATVFLAGLGVSRRPARPLFAMAVGCLLLALGRHFAPAAWALHLPGLGAFRYPVKYAVGAMFGLSVLGGVGAQRAGAWLRVGSRQTALGPGVVALFLGVAGGVALISLVFASTVNSGFVSAARWAWVTSCLVTALLLVVRTRPGWGRRWPLGLAGVVCFEALFAPRPERMLCLPAELSRASPVAAQLQREGVQRVSVWVDRDDGEVPWCEPTSADEVVRHSRERLSASRFMEERLSAIGGYGFRDPWRAARAFEQGPTAYALAGVSHFVFNVWGGPRFAGPTPELTVVDDVWVWRAATAPLPRAWVVTSAVPLSDERALAALRDPVARFEREVVTPAEGGPSRHGADCRSAPVGLTELRPETVVLDVDACDDGFVVLADAWYPGWRVSVDGVDVPSFRANFFLRGAAVPKGHHLVTWQYRPRSFEVGALLSLLGSAAMALVLAWGRWHAPLGRSPA